MFHVVILQSMVHFLKCPLLFSILNPSYDDLEEQAFTVKELYLPQDEPYKLLVIWLKPWKWYIFSVDKLTVSGRVVTIVNTCFNFKIL
jgi:hypothetical protein